MSHPEPERRTDAPPGTSLLVRLTPEQAQAVTHGTEGEALRWWACTARMRGGAVRRVC
jgi:hypothetical protein